MSTDSISRSIRRGRGSGASRGCAVGGQLRAEGTILRVLALEMAEFALPPYPGSQIPEVRTHCPPVNRTPVSGEAGATAV
jgi:hypothetical protein